MVHSRSYVRSRDKDSPQAFRSAVKARALMTALSFPVVESKMVVVAGNPPSPTLGTLTTFIPIPPRPEARAGMMRVVTSRVVKVLRRGACMGEGCVSVLLSLLMSLLL
jgi:hypothetical protein